MLDQPFATIDTETLTPVLAAPRDGGGRDAGVLARGARLGRYVVLHALGSGGMGNVYAAYDPELDRTVAVKVLRGDLIDAAGRARAARRLLREARAMARLTHPNVVAVFDAGTVGARLFVAMELVDGVDLAAWLAARPRDWRAVLAVFEQAGRALAAAHRSGLAHRDFKPSNVMLARDGRVRVVDFGLARALDGDHPPPGAAPPRPAEPPPSEPSEPAGTPAYMAPEQRDGRPADARADQFSYCVALWQALHRTLPFAGRDAGTLHAAIAAGRPLRPATTAVPGRVRAALRRGLAAEPAARFPSMEALLAALARDPARRRRRWLIALAAVVPMTAGIGLAVSRPAPCGGAGERLAGVWNDTRRKAARDAFAATGVPYAADAWRRVSAALEAYVEGWTAMHHETCRATHVLGEQSPAMLDRRMVCLDGRLAALRALSDRFLAADARTVAGAVPAAGQLPSLTACADRPALAALEPPAPPAAPAVAAIRSRLAAAWVDERFGRYRQAAEAAHRLLAEARALAYRPLEGEVRFLLGVAEGRAGHKDVLRAEVHHSARIALETHHRPLLARALTFLVLAGFIRGDPAEAYGWADLAEAALGGLGERASIDAERLFFLGMALNQDGRHRQAIERFRQALAVDPAGAPARAAMAYNNIGIAYRHLGRLDLAAAALERAWRDTVALLGEQHPHVAAALVNLGNLQASRGQRATAARSLRRALAIQERALGPHHPDLARVLCPLGALLVDLGRAAEAGGHLERAIALRDGAAEDPAVLAACRFQLARALAAGGQRARARGLARDARDTYSALGPRVARDLEEVERWLRSADDGA